MILGREEGAEVGLLRSAPPLAMEVSAAAGVTAYWDGQPVQFPIETLTGELKVGVTKSADGKIGFTAP